MKVAAGKWLPLEKHHGDRHPTLPDYVYFSIGQSPGVGTLSGYVTTAEFWRLCRRFRIKAMRT